MAEKRKNDVNPRSHFRTERMFMEGGQWYFHTREGTIEGPFRDMVEASTRLDSYISLTNSGLAPSDGKFSLADLEVI